jgi:phage tail sheath protein FI
MVDLLTPDVYVQEVPAGPRPIEAVGTRTAGFVGIAPKANALPGEATAINNWLQFTRLYTDPDSTSTPLSNAVFGFFQNGGSRCFVVNIRRADGVGVGLSALEAEDEIAIVAAPGYTDIGSYDAILTHCELLADRVAVLDAPLIVDDIEQLTRVATSVAARAGGRAAGAKPADAKAAGDDPPNQKPGLRPRPSDSGFGALYFPGITVRDPIGGQLVDVTPSGHVAGIWARTDATRGVHKAPANEIVRGALNVTYRLTREEQGVLNPVGVNCIRYFPREGIRVWGARTLADSASEWRYLNVRRLFNMIEESIAEATRWIVFEPNDRQLWKSIRRDVGAFLTRVWLDGALMGATAGEAFFVKCDEETNPPEVIDAGQVVAVIGIAPVKPAEFVIFQISQSASGAEIATEGGNGA